MALPLRAVDLAVKDIYTLSFAGSHSLLDASGNRPGIPSLVYRQFSDLNPGGPLFTSMAEIMIMDDMGEPVEPEILNYMWRPDFIRARFRFEGFTEMQQIVAYADEETCICDIKLKPLGSRSLHVRVAGTVSEKADANITKLPNKGFSVQVQAEMKNADGTTSTKLQKSFTVVFSTAPAYLSTEGSTFIADFRTDDVKEVTLAVVVSERSAKGALARILAQPSETVSQTARRVNYWLADVKKPELREPDAVKMYYNAWYQLWQNIERPAGFWTHPIICPGKVNYGRGTRLWDTAFHIMALLYGGGNAVELAKDQVRVFVDGSRQIGHLPGEVWQDAIDPQVQPPGFLTWAAMEIYKVSEDKAFLQEVYNALAENNRWFYTERDSNGNGLCEWQNHDSGMVDAVDLNSWLYIDQIKLAEISDALGKKADAAAWRDKAESTRKNVIEKMWDEEQGCFWDLAVETGQPVKVKTPAIFWPMFAGIATDEQAARLVKHLDPDQGLWTEFPLPSVSTDDPAFEPENHWRGAVTISSNWITIQALERYGYKEKAAELRKKSLELIQKNPVPMEYYNPLTGIGLGAANLTLNGALYIILCQKTSPS